MKGNIGILECRNCGKLEWRNGGMMEWKTPSNMPFFQYSLFVLSIAILFSSDLFSQSFTNSPYSRYGLGELQYTGFANNIPMGGIYNAMQNDTTAPYYINFSNPAAHASTRLTVFDFGLKSNTSQLETTDKKFLTNKTSLSYLALAFPIIKNTWGGSFGILPYSSVGYKIYDERAGDSTGTVKYSYEGEGGINQLYFGNGFKVKRFSAGLNISYLFGDLAYSSRDSFPASSYFLNTKLSQVTRVSDFYYTMGAQYRQPLKKGWSLTLGVTGNVQTDLNVKRTTFAATYKNNFGVEVMKDTIINQDEVRDTLTIPMMIGGGIVLKKGEKWIFGFDYSMQDWSSFTSFGQTGTLKNSQRFAAGVQFIPNKNGDKEPYYKKIFYRAGFRYTDTYLELRNTALTDYAVTFGMGLPLKRKYYQEEGKPREYTQSIFNIGFEIGESGTIENSLIRERYVKAIVSFTLNDRWFIKRKYD